MSADRHPRQAELSLFVEGSLPPEDNRRVVRHLLAGCEICRRIAGELWQPAITDGSELTVDRAMQVANDCLAGIEAERAAAPGLLRELEAQPEARQLLLVLNSRRFCNWFLCEALLKRAFEAGFGEPPEAIRLAEIGLALAGRMVDLEPAEPVNHDLLARGWSVLGNARRISSDLDGAEEAFGQALGALEGGSGDPLEEADVELHHGLLHHARRRFADAMRCFDRAARLYRSVGDDHLIGKALADKARSVCECGDTEGTIELLRRALTLLDPQRDPRLVYVAQHNLTWAFNESGRLGEALTTLQEILPMHVQSAKASDLLRLRWLEGKLAKAQGELERAEAAFREVCDAFLDRQAPYDAALASLDLASVLFEQDRLGEMRLLAAETLSIFSTLGVHREALTALALFEQAVERERVSLRFIADLAGYLQRARSDPKLAFQPPV